MIRGGIPGGHFGAVGSVVWDVQRDATSAFEPREGRLGGRGKGQFGLVEDSPDAFGDEVLDLASPEGVVEFDQLTSVANMLRDINRGIILNPYAR